MEADDLHLNFPNLNKFMRICVAMVQPLGLKNNNLRFKLYRELSNLWIKLGTHALYRYDVSHCARNIFFIATGTGQLCKFCMNFDLTLDPSVHHTICVSEVKREDKPLEYYGLGLNQKSEISCNTCSEVKPSDVKDAESFYETHVHMRHTLPVHMLSGHLGFRRNPKVEAFDNKPPPFNT